MTVRRPLSQNPTEDQLEDAILELAGLRGWRRHHQRPGMNKKGEYRSQIKGDKGFPDLVLVHAGRRRLIFRELKSRTGRLSDEQIAWAEALEYAGADYALWTPVEWFDGTIDKELIG